MEVRPSRASWQRYLILWLKNEQALAAFSPFCRNNWGLTLKAGNGPVEVIVSDHAERPSEN
jgi:hypothetical protein